MATPRTYAAGAVQVLVGGGKLSGLAKGTAVTISQNGDSTSTEVGLDGEARILAQEIKEALAAFFLVKTALEPQFRSPGPVLRDRAGSAFQPVFQNPLDCSQALRASSLLDLRDRLWHRSPKADC